MAGSILAGLTVFVLIARRDTFIQRAIGVPAGLAGSILVAVAVLILVAVRDAFIQRAIGISAGLTGGVLVTKYSFLILPTECLRVFYTRFNLILELIEQLKCQE